MTQAVSYDLDSIGGGYGGLGGGAWGNNPLLWLITLGFLKGNNGLFGGDNNAAGAGVLAGETQAKLDCLGQQHATLMSQIAKNDTDANFVTLGTAIDSLAGITRDQTAAVTAQINDLRAQNAECCCEIREGIQGVNTAIAMQTNAIVMNNNENTQKILNAITDGRIEQKDSEIRRLQDALQTQTIVANCHGGNGGNNIDINVLARALQGQGQAA